MHSQAQILLKFQVTKSVVSLLTYYGWKKFSILYENVWENVADSLKKQAEKKNISVNHLEEVRDMHLCCANELECCGHAYLYQV